MRGVHQIRLLRDLRLRVCPLVAPHSLWQMAAIDFRVWDVGEGPAARCKREGKAVLATKISQVGDVRTRRIPSPVG